MQARDFRKWGLEALQKNWLTAVALCFVGTVLGGGIDLISGFFMPTTEESMTQLPNMLELAGSGAWTSMFTITVVSILLGIVLGGALQLGMAHYFTNLTANRPASFRNLFARFDILGKALWMKIVTGFYILLWTLTGVIPATVAAYLLTMGMAQALPGFALLFGMIGAIPGVVAIYRYAMVPYLIAEFPDLLVRDAMKESKRLMDGNKWRLFCLNLSFIGWALMAFLLTMGFGSFILTPYMQAAEAAFYLKVTGRENLRYVQEEPQV